MAGPGPDLGGTVKIGLITDMCGVYADIDGKRGAEAMRMAIADIGGAIRGKKTGFPVADHQNKPDVAASMARECFDREGVGMLIGGSNSGASLAMAKAAAEKKKVFIAIGAGSAQLTNEQSSPYTVNYAYDTVALARGTGATMVKQGGRRWYFFTADYAFGQSLEKARPRSSRRMAAGPGSVKHPLGASDFSSFLLQAQGTDAQVPRLADAGGDFINAVKAANELGQTRKIKLAVLLVFINDIHSLGLQKTKGLDLTDGWYWNLNDDPRAWSKHYFANLHKLPSMLQAADYAATMTYLNAVRAMGSDDDDKIMAYAWCPICS